MLDINNSIKKMMIIILIIFEFFSSTTSIIVAHYIGLSDMIDIFLDKGVIDNNDTKAYIKVFLIIMYGKFGKEYTIIFANVLSPNFMRRLQETKDQVVAGLQQQNNE